MDQEPTKWIKKEETHEVQTELHFIAQDYACSMNVKEELEEGVNKEFLEDPLKAGDPSVCVKQDPELKHHAAGSEHNVETSTRCASDSARFTQTTGGSCSISCEETCHHRLVQDELVIDMEKSTHGFSTNTEDVTIDKECSVATQYDCSTREKELHVYSCNLCHQSFSSKYGLIMHVFMHIDGTQPPSYVCKWCGEVFHSNVVLKKHMRMSENCQVLTADSHEKYGHSDEHETTNLLDSEGEVSVTEHNEQSSCKETWKDSKKPSNDMCNTHMTNDREKTSNYGTLSIAVNVSAQADLLTANRTHRCGICGKLFARSYDLKRHVYIHTGKRLHKCDICFKWFAQSRYLKAHTLIHTRQKPHKCVMCGESFARPNHLKTHTLLHTGKKLHKCEICGKSFAGSGVLKNHSLIHTGKKPHKCDICGKSFTMSGHLRNHVLIHTGKKPHKCEICGKSFARAHYLKTHTLFHTRKKILKCEICGKYFPTLSNLNRHVLIHTGKKPHKCEMCGKSFAMKDELNRHVFFHTGKKPHKCEICGKCFAMSSDLKVHTFIHTGIKPHKCQFCGKCFAKSSYLKIHTLIHTGIKPHKCEICGKSFTIIGNLKKHMLIHTGKKPHKCEICRKSFATSGDLKTHAFEHTGS
ncbi:zinc finger protein 729-like isoform X2 [Schistocerca nitens]|uniref:zinc finger protein 729-like isoform X2 n=1 Tax=Schistocerca nitens TaxID=7011 RepID=UPI0021194B2B|nr:zinc finger protein 729-like isoform X2 [Schistocerca nitens]